MTNSNPQDISPITSVAGNAYALANTLILSNGTNAPAVYDSLGNLIGGGGRVFTLEERPTGKKFVRFGDGIFGRKLVAGELVTITYRTGVGSAGNAAEQSVTTAVSSLPFVAAVNNPGKFSGGADEQSIDQLRELIPASLRTLDRAVSKTDYADILKSTFSEVSTASAEQNNSDTGVDLNVYVVPTGIGITKISANPFLRNKLTAFLERRKMVTVQFAILDAFGSPILLNLKVYAEDTASKATLRSAINNAFANYFSLTTGGPNNSGIDFAEPILTEDLDKIIKAIPGINRFEFTRHTYRPRIAINAIGPTTTYTNSLVEIFPNVEQLEWLLVASGPVTVTSGTLLFSNIHTIPYTYDSPTGLLTYASYVEIENIAPGDIFKDGTGATFPIFGVDVANHNLHLATGLSVNTTVSNANSGSIRTGNTVSNSFKCFKKINAISSNLAIDSITDNELDLSIKTGTGISLSARLLLDNTQVFVANQYATGDFYLVDSGGNIWEILANTFNTFTTASTPVNDASVTVVAPGVYKIVNKLLGQEILFNGNIFTIQYNSENTVYSSGAQFSNIGTIGDAFEISQKQNNIGTLGVAVDLVTYTPSTKTLILNNQPDLQSVDSTWNLIDKSGQVFNLSAIDNRTIISTSYDSTNLDSSLVLKSSGAGQQYSQGFKVPTTNIFPVVSFYLKRSGNIIGNLTAKIVNDNGSGKPNLASIVATSIIRPVNVAGILSTYTSISAVPNTSFDKVSFTFTTPATLTAATQYHLVLSSDAGYQAAQADNIKVFDNSGPAAYTYAFGTGIIHYTSAVDLTPVSPGNYFRDGSGAIFLITSVSPGDNTVTIAASLSINLTVGTDSGSIYKKDNIYIGSDTSTPVYANGQSSSYDGTNWTALSSTVFPFTVEGPKSISVTSNLTPSLGAGATISKRYYDDQAEISLVLGITGGIITSATNANAYGRGTINLIPNSKLDTFVFKTSPYIGDIVNLRKMEIPEYNASNVSIEILGGID